MKKNLPPAFTTTIPTKEELVVYPNPVKDQLFLALPSYSFPLKVQIYNNAGELVFQQTKADDSPISLAKLSNGLYICQVKTPTNKTTTTKFILQH